MASCVVRDWQGKEAGKATLDLKVAKEASAVDLMHRAVLRQQAHMRQGTASTLTRSEVRGGGRKPYKQKGTGREITEALGRLGIAADTKVLIVLTNPSEMVRRSVRNLDKVKLISANHLNVFDLLHANSLVVGEDALTTIQEVYGDD